MKNPRPWDHSDLGGGGDSYPGASFDPRPFRAPPRRSGADHHNTQFSSAQKTAIRTRVHGDGATYREVAAEMGVTPTTIWRIAHKKD